MDHSAKQDEPARLVGDEQPAPESNRRPHLRRGLSAAPSNFEARSSATPRLAGTLLIPQPSALAFGTGLSVLTLAAILAALVFGSYAPKQPVTGYLIPSAGVVKVMAPRPGVVVDVFVEEGKTVARGDRLMSISTEQGMASGSGVQTSKLSSIREQSTIVRQQLEALTRYAPLERSRLLEKLRGLEDENRFLAGRAQLLSDEVEATAGTLAKISELNKAGYTSSLDVSTWREKSAASRVRLDEVNGLIAANAFARRDAQLQVEQLTFEQSERRATLQASLLELSRQTDDLEIDQAFVVTATSAGKVTALQFNAGGAVSTTQPLMVILTENSPLVAHLMIPSDAIGFVKPGQPILLRYKAFPYEKYGTYSAHVGDVSQTALRSDEWGEGSAPSTTSVYRATAVLDRQTVAVAGKSVSLQSGMVFDADIVLEDRALWRWFLEPLVALKGRL